MFGTLDTKDTSFLKDSSKIGYARCNVADPSCKNVIAPMFDPSKCVIFGEFNTEVASILKASRNIGYARCNVANPSSKNDVALVSDPPKMHINYLENSTQKWHHF